jgi:hypothetical protein
MTLAELLSATLHGDQVNQAGDELVSRQSDPAFAEELAAVMADRGCLESVRLAAAIQLRHLFEKEIIQDCAPARIVELFDISPQLIQRQLRLILRYVVKIHTLTDRFPDLLSYAFAALEAHPITSITLLKTILIDCPPTIPDAGDKCFVFSQIAAYSPQIFQVCQASGLDPAIVRASLLMATHLSVNFAPQPIDGWFSLVVTCFEVPDLSPYALKLADALFRCRDALNFEMARQLFETITQKISDGQFPQKAVCHGIAFLTSTLFSDDFWRAMSSSLSDLITGVFFPLFCLSADEFRQKDTDLFDFLLNSHISVSECDSPLSCAVVFLLHFGPTDPDAIPGLLQFVWQQLENPDPGIVFGALQLAGYSLSGFDQRDDLISALAPSVCPFLERVWELGQSRDSSLVMSGVLLFLSKMSRFLNPDPLPWLEFALDVLLASPGGLLGYSAAVALGPLLRVTIEWRDSVLAGCGDSCAAIVHAVLALVGEFPTNPMEDAVPVVFDFFMPYLLPCALPYVAKLLEMYAEYAAISLNEKDRRAPQAASQLARLQGIIRNIISNMRGRDPDFFAELVAPLLELFRAVPTVDLPDLVDLLDVLCVCTPEATPGFQAIPIHVHERFREIEHSAAAVQLLAHLILRAPAAMAEIEECFMPILEILGWLVQDRDYQREAGDLTLAMCAQMAGYEHVREHLGGVLAIATQVNSVDFADGFAGLVLVLPLETLSNDLNFKICLLHAAPMPFLAAAAVMLNNMGNMPGYVQGRQGDVIARVHEAYQDFIAEGRDQFRDTGDDQMFNVVEVVEALGPWLAMGTG